VEAREARTDNPADRGNYSMTTLLFSSIKMNRTSANFRHELEALSEEGEGRGAVAHGSRTFDEASVATFC
jgi:hypothetical protein